MGNRRRARPARAVSDGVGGAAIITGTDVEYEIAGHYGADPAAGVADGQHAWTMIVTFRVANPEGFLTQTQHFDAENVVSVMGPLCWRCEQGYVPGQTPAGCPGQPPGDLQYVR